MNHQHINYIFNQAQGMKQTKLSVVLPFSFFFKMHIRTGRDMNGYESCPNLISGLSKFQRAPTLVNGRDSIIMQGLIFRW